MRSDSALEVEGLEFRTGDLPSVRNLIHLTTAIALMRNRPREVPGTFVRLSEIGRLGIFSGVSGMDPWVTGTMRRHPGINRILTLIAHRTYPVLRQPGRISIENRDGGAYPIVVTVSEIAAESAHYFLELDAEAKLKAGLIAIGVGPKEAEQLVAEI
jgi:hypothetical protein